MYVAVKSLLVNSSVERIYLLIEDDTFPEWLPDICTVINCSNQTIFDLDGVNAKRHYTYMCLLKTALCKILPADLDTVLWMDDDAICVRDIDAIWDLPIADKYFAAAHEWINTTDNYLYTNAGVVLFNLKKLRDGTTDKMVQILNTVPYPFPDQDVLNEVCQGFIYDMPSEYCAMMYTEPCKTPRIMHFIGNNDRLPKYHAYRKYRDLPMADILAFKGIK